MKHSYPAIRCDVNHVLENQRSWSEKPSSADMEQVRELLDLIKGVTINGGLVAVSFIVCRIQPCMERAHVGYDFKGDNDGTWESTGMLTKDEVLERDAELFTSNASFSVLKQTSVFNCMNPPP